MERTDAPLRALFGPCSGGFGSDLIRDRMCCLIASVERHHSSQGVEANTSKPTHYAHAVKRRSSAQHEKSFNVPDLIPLCREGGRLSPESAFPRAVRDRLGKALYLLQAGVQPGMALSKPMPAVARGVSELRLRGGDAQFRTFYYTASVPRVFS